MIELRTSLMGTSASLAGHIVGYARFAWGLRGFLRERATAERARELLLRRQSERNANFLALMKRSVFDNAASPYMPLLRGAGCEYQDFEASVLRAGIESTLQQLQNEGVYVTIDEFKCRQPIVRGAVTVQCSEQDFDNPVLASGIRAASGGSRSKGTATTLSLERTGYVAHCQAVALAAHGLAGCPTLLWMPALPSAAGLVVMLQLSKLGMPPMKWFSPVASSAVSPPLSKRLATLYLVHAGRLFGSRIPAPEYVGTERVRDIVRCIEVILTQGRGCVVCCSPSSAAAAARTAVSAGISLSGVTFMTGGEPLSPAKNTEIRSAGAHAVNMYASSEMGTIGYGCAGTTPASDDIHVLEGSQAVIQYERATPFGGGVVQSLLFSSLHERSAKILLNVESGDHGVLETRECSCMFGELGLKRHLHTIRSFDKLTGQGMTFVGTDMVRIIEHVLPGRFGGASTDYQMVEREDVEGQTRLDVIVSPDVGAVDEAQVVALVLRELSKGSDTNRMMAEVWRERRVLRVRRERPHLTAGGKLLSLHIEKKA